MEIFNMTNRTLSIPVYDDYTLTIETETKLGRLNELFEKGNSLRAEKGLGQLYLEHYLRRPDTVELIKALEKRYGNSNHAESAILEISNNNGLIKIKNKKDLTVLKQKAGRYGGTYANIHIFLDAAAALDPDFKIDLYNLIINNRLLENRDESALSFRALTDVYKAKILKGRDAPHWVYSNLSTAIKDKFILPSENWDEQSAEMLADRDRLHDFLIMAINTGMLDTDEKIYNFIRSHNQ
jgi:hypothetical protein